MYVCRLCMYVFIKLGQVCTCMYVSCMYYVRTYLCISMCVSRQYVR